MPALEGVLVQIKTNNIFLLSMGGIPFLLGMFISCSLTSDLLVGIILSFIEKGTTALGFFPLYL